MAHFPETKQYGGRMNPFWLEPSKRDVMGYRLNPNAPITREVPIGSRVQQGYPLYCYIASGVKYAHPCKYINVISVANDKKTLTVEKGSLALIGETYFISGADTRVLLTISTIDSNDDNSDIIVLSATNNDIKAGDTIVWGKTVGSGSSATIEPMYLPNRIAAQYAKTTDINETISAMHDGIVLKNIVKYPEEYINAETFPGSDLLVGCPKILFIVQ